MHLFRRPCGADVQRLLDAAGLPSGDIGTEALEHFFGCGAEHAPQGVAGLEICGDDAPLRAKVVAASAIFLWLGVLFCGHMLPFIGNAF